MSIYSEFDPGKCGETGEWAQLRYANKLERWKSWRKKAAVIGPVAVAYEGMWGADEYKIEFDKPTLVICGQVSRQKCTVNGELTRGIGISFPLVYDHEIRAFGEILYSSSEPVTHIWVPDAEAGFIRSHTGYVPYVDATGSIYQVPAETLTHTM